MPNKSKIKGSNFERKIVHLLNTLFSGEYQVERVPLSGAQDGFKGDIWLHLPDKLFKIECKKRKSGFKQIYKWLEGNDMVVIEQDRCNPILCIPIKKPP